MHNGKESGVILPLIEAVIKVVREAFHAEETQAVSHWLKALRIFRDVCHGVLHGLHELLAQTFPLLAVVARRVEILLEGVSLKTMRHA